jgi:serine/threonine protein kinase
MLLSPVEHLVQAVKALPLLDTTQKAELDQSLRARFAEPKALAQELLRRGWLTSFQVNQVLTGRGAGLVLGQYVLLERLGEGGTGQVFKARHQHMNRTVAVKVIRKELLADPEVVKRFYREIRVISQLSHPNIVHALDAGPVGQVHLLIMEHVEGTDLGRLVKQRGPLSVGEACDYVRQAALGLQHAHEKGLIHRDIKPSNLFLTSGPGAPGAGPGKEPAFRRALVKLLDLGLARCLHNGDGELTATLTPAGPVTMGTPDYMAPEQAIDFHHVDIRADIYSLGCTLYSFLSGQAPFADGSVAQKLVLHQLKDPKPLERFRSDVPPALTALLRRMMAKEPNDRPRTPAEVAAAIAPLCAAGSSKATLVAAAPSEPWSTVPVLHRPMTETPASFVLNSQAPTEKLLTSPASASRGLRRRRWLMPAVGAALLAVVALLAVLLTRQPGGRDGQAASVGGDTKPSAVASARLERLQGEVVVHAGAARRPASLGAELRAGERVQTIGPNSQARITLGNHVSLELGPETSLAAPARGEQPGGEVSLVTLGLVRGEVRGQPGQGPLTLMGPQGEVKILSGRFVLAGVAGTTWIRVDDGLARVTRTGDSKALEVRAGQYLTLRPNLAPVVKPLAQGIRVLDDFESQSLSNWYPWSGDPNSTVTRKLVSPGKVGKGALRVDYDLKRPGGAPGGTNFDMNPAQDWSNYRCLHFWFWGNQTRNSIGISLVGADVDWHFLDDFAGWREFSVPLSDFKRKQGAAPSPPVDLSKVHRVIFVLYTTGKNWFQLDQVQLLEHEILR